MPSGIGFAIGIYVQVALTSEQMHQFDLVLMILLIMLIGLWEAANRALFCLDQAGSRSNSKDQIKLRQCLLARQPS